MNARGNYAVDCAFGFNFNLENCKNIEYIGRINTVVMFGKIVTVKIGNSIPPVLAGISKRNGNKYCLYVPEGCIGSYYDADGWKEFDVIKEIGEE